MEYLSRMQLTRDFYVVWVDDIWENTKTKSGIITTNTAFLEKQNQTDGETEERGGYKRRYGIVQEVPLTFTDDVVETVAPLNPQPRAYVNHEYIQQMHNAGQRGYRDITIQLVNGKTYHEDPRLKYYPSTFEKYDVVTKAQIARGNDIRKGDTVYCDHSFTDMERYLGPYKKGHLFSVSVEEIHCVYREVQVFKGHKLKQKRILPQSRWVFVKLDMEDWDEIVNKKTGFLEKVAPKNKPLQGTVVAAQRHELENKTVLFEREADAPITVDGRELTVMKEYDILATLKP